VTHFKMLTKEFPKRTEQNKERYNQIKFPSQSWKKGHWNTERTFWHFFVRCFSNVWRNCCLSLLECSDIYLDSVDLMWKQKSYIFFCTKAKHQSQLKFRTYINNALAALLILRHRSAKQLLWNVYARNRHICEIKLLISN